MTDIRHTVDNYLLCINVHTWPTYELHVTQLLAEKRTVVTVSKWPIVTISFVPEIIPDSRRSKSAILK
jgi:hypothetical protein